MNVLKYFTNDKIIMYFLEMRTLRWMCRRLDEIELEMTTLERERESWSSTYSRKYGRN
jgi:hypothetical protein